MEEDERFILILSVGLLGAVAAAAVLLMVCDPILFPNSYIDDEDDDEEEYYMTTPDGYQVKMVNPMKVVQVPPPPSPGAASGRTSIPSEGMPPPSVRNSQQTPQVPKRKSKKSLGVQTDPMPSPSHRSVGVSTQEEESFSAEQSSSLPPRGDIPTSVRVSQQQQQQQQQQLSLQQQGTSGSSLQQRNNSAHQRLVAIEDTKTQASSIVSVEEENIPPPPPGIVDSYSDEDEEGHHHDMDASSEQQQQQKKKSMRKQVARAVVPRMERLPWPRFLYLCGLVALPSFLYILYFTVLGLGEETFYYLTENYGQYSSLVGSLTTLYMICLYWLDVEAWPNLVVQRFCILLFVLGVILTVLLLTGNYPYGPICLFAALVPMWLVAVNQIQCCGGGGRRQRLRTRDYVGSLSGPLFYVSVGILIIFLCFTFLEDTHRYNKVTKVAFAQYSGCEPNLVEYPFCASDYVSTEAPDHNLDNVTTDTPIELTSPTTAPTVDLPWARLRQLHVIPGGGQHSDEEEELYHDDNRITQELQDDASTETLDAEVCFTVQISPPAFLYPNNDTNPECESGGCTDKVYGDCLNGFIIWAGPLMVSMVLFFLSFFCTFLRGGEKAESDIINFGKLWIFLLFTIWVTASLAGVTAGLSGALIAMTLASFVGSILLVAMTRSKSESKTQAEELWARVEENYGAYLDVARGLFLVTCFPFLLIYFAMSIGNQVVRSFGLPWSKPAAGGDCFTKRVRKQIEGMRAWDRAKVLTYALYWGVFFMVMQVIVVRFTTLLMSWLIEATSAMNLGVVTVVLMFVGMFLFLLPPVPGVPIYVTLGVVILPTGRDLLGVVGSMAYACAISLLLKLVACTVQQKLIGENLAKYVSVRKLVAINSTVIKAMRLVLAQPGMGIDKVCILVGGPDWPTSVLCGIMGLDLIPVLVGTLPVFVLILPTVLMGSFTYMSGLTLPNGELEFPSSVVLGTVFAAVAAVTQFAAMVLAAYYLEQTTSQRADEIAQIEDDEAVAVLEKEEEAMNECYNVVTQWERVPGSSRMILYLAFLVMVMSCYLVQFFSASCFAEYQLTDTIAEDLDGKWYNLVTPLGWAAIGLFAFSCMLLWVFISWASGEAKKELESRPPSGDEPTPEQAIVPAVAGTVAPA